MGYAFISYSTKNQSVADSMRQLLHQNGIDSWMAPTDIPAGSRYAQVITRAIKECACVVLMLSEASQNSTWVAKEIERAVNYRKVIIPVQLEDLVLNEEFEFYISTDQIVAVKQLDSRSPEVQKILTSLRVICADAGNCGSRQVTPIRQGPAADLHTGDSQAYYEKGEQFYGQKQWDKAVEWYRKAAVLGHAQAQRSLGICYYLGGNGIEQDYAQAAKWSREAADKNDAQGQEVLGNCYYYGYGIEQNYKRAAKCYRKSAEQGRAIGQLCLGNCYYRGHGVEQDYGQAVKWFRKAAEQGDADAQYWLGYCYHLGLGIEPDPVQAAALYRMAADQGNANAQANLGTLYYFGNGVAKNLEEAKKWYRKAAKKGNAPAKTMLALLIQ